MNCTFKYACCFGFFGAGQCFVSRKFECSFFDSLAQGNASHEHVNVQTIPFPLSPFPTGDNAARNIFCNHVRFACHIKRVIISRRLFVDGACSAEAKHIRNTHWLTYENRSIKGCVYIYIYIYI